MNCCYELRSKGHKFKKLHERKFGDNDRLAALVSGLINADRLIILSDVDGLYSSDPQKTGTLK